jgi:hypothetical protein
MTKTAIRTITRIAILLLVSGYAAGAESQIRIVVGREATPLEKLAAEELATHLQRIYPDHQFPIVNSPSHNVPQILLGTLQSQPNFRERVSEAKLTKPESFVVTTVKEDGAGVGIVAGADARGTLYGVYALLEKLGCGFYLSYNTQPAPRSAPFRFDGWDLSDAPLFPDRVVLPWHNFLSGPSTWDFSQWQQWITQTSRMRYNTLMVHCYGNNPMFTFTFRGNKKPVGYLSSTAKGRDWSTEHVNDVRRMFGGEVFEGPVFASSAALVPDEERSDAAIALMKRVFSLAHERGLHVAFVWEIDTHSANPQELVRQLPAEARLTNGKFLLANPDSPEGYEYYRTQVTTLLGLYPQIDRLVSFFREADEDTPWRGIKVESFPETWKAEFRMALEKNPHVRDDKDAARMFAMSKVVAAFRRALRELGRTDVEFGASTFDYDWALTADALFPPDTSLVVLDWFEIIKSDVLQGLLRQLGTHRKVYPVQWATHDDWAYLGRPYTPYTDYSSLLMNSKTSGFGIIHWTTRPVDLYFKSLAAQAWEGSKNEPLTVTCREMAARTFGESSRETGGEYLFKWVTEAPRFARETLDTMMDSTLKEPSAVIAKCRERLDLLAKIDSGQLSEAERQRLEYYRGLENFIIAFYQSQTAWENAQRLRDEGELDKARAALRGNKPESVIEQFARFSSLGGITRGEQGLVVSLNLRWLPYIVSEKQAEGLEPIRVKFQPTFHEPLAQLEGTHTFYFDRDRQMWKALGEKETGIGTFADPSDASADEICTTGLEGVIDHGMSVRIGPIMGDHLVPGRYTAHLLFAPQPAFADVYLSGSASTLPYKERLEIYRAGAQPVQITHTMEVRQGALDVSISPYFGKVRLCGAMLEPAVDGSVTY